MGLVKLTARIFIDLFGITPPTPEEEGKYAWILFGLSVLTVLVVAAVFLLLVGRMVG